MHLDHRCKNHRDIVEWSKPCPQGFGVLLHGLRVLDKEIPFVHNEHTGLTVAYDQVEDVHILRLHTHGGIYHQNADIAMLDSTDRTHHGIEFEVFVNLAFLAYAGGIYEHEFMPELVVVGLDGIACRASHGSDYVAFLSQESIGDRGLSHVRLADDGYARKPGIRVLGFRFFGKDLHDSVQQVAGATAVGRGDGIHLSEAETVKFIGIVHLLAGIHLVDA